MANRLAVVLDPPGYTRIDEPGWVHRYSGADFDRMLPDKGGRIQWKNANIWNPPGTPWVLPRPRQWSSEWYKDARMADHVIRMENWTFDASVTLSARREYERTRKIDSDPINDNQWMKLYIESGAGGLDARNYGAMATAIGGGAISTSGIKTIATCNGAFGLDLSGGTSEYHPWIGFEQLPSPDDLMVFGWGQMAMLFNSAEWWLLYDPTGTSQSWELKSHGKYAGDKPTRKNERTYYGWGGTSGTVSDPSPVTRQFAAIPVGLDDIYLSFFPTAGEVPPVTMRDELPGHLSSRFGVGAWYIGTTGNRVLDIQAQVVGYETADSDAVFTDEPPIFFDFGAVYRPTQQPQLNTNAILHPAAGETVATSYISNALTFTVTGGGTEQIIVAVRDETNDSWNSDGTHSRGSFRLYLKPDTDKPYLAPQVKDVNVRFPAVLTPRTVQTLVLEDTHWAALNVETSLYNPESKRLTFAIHDRKDNLFVGTSLLERDGYPVHILRDADGDGDYETMVARGVVREVQLEELLPAQGLNAAVNAIIFECEGISSWLDEGFIFFPEVVPPSGESYINHMAAIQECITKTGLNPADTGLFFWAYDPYITTNELLRPTVADLPGSVAEIGTINDVEDDGAYNPDWTETVLQYVLRVSSGWRGWNFYEKSSKFIYSPDIAWAIRVGKDYYRQGTIHQDYQDLESDTPYLHYLSNPKRWTQKAPFTAVRVSGKDANKGKHDIHRSFHVIDYDASELNTLSNPNFLGHLRIHTITSKFGVTERALRQVARIARLRHGRRKKGWTIVCPLAPWEGPDDGEDTLDVGYIWNFEGLGDHIITRRSWFVLGKGIVSNRYVSRMTLTGESVYNGNGAGTNSGIEGGWPGIGG